MILPIREEVTKVQISKDGRAIEVYYKQEVEEQEGKPLFEKYFPIVNASELTLDCSIMKYEPQTERQANFKKKLEKAIKSGLHDFRAQKYQPSHCDSKGRLCYKERSWYFSYSLPIWVKLASEFYPEKNSRIGTPTEMVAFLGIIIKTLVEKHGYSMNKAWYAVCDDSTEIALYKYQHPLLSQIGEFCGFGNGYRITINDEEDSKFAFILFGGHPLDKGDYRPLANTIPINYRGDYVDESSTAWIVTDV